MACLTGWRKKTPGALLDNERSIMPWLLKVGIVCLTMISTTLSAMAQIPSGHAQMHGPMGAGDRDQPMMQGPMHERMMQDHQGVQGGMNPRDMMGMMGMQGGLADRPTMSGQEAFGAIQEVLQILEADPATDWSKVNIAALREHLIDMNEVTLRAVASERALDDGIEIAVTGEGRTLDAIKRMVPAHVSELAKIGWKASSEDLPNGVRLTITTGDAKQLTKLKALGFMGIMVQGGHHQPHHLMLAKGELGIH
jgi:hypothetical protein